MRLLQADGVLRYDRGLVRSGGTKSLEYGDGVVKLSGLKLWPKPLPAVFVEPFQRGFPLELDAGDLRFDLDADALKLDLETEGDGVW